MSNNPKIIKLKRQFDKMSYLSTTELAARTGFERNERYEVEIKRVNDKVADLIYQQQNNTTLLHDGVICVYATSDANQEGSKWVRKDAKAVGRFDVGTTLELESGAEIQLTDITATGVKLGKLYHFQKLASESETTLQLGEVIVTGDDKISITLKNNTDGWATHEGNTVIQWCEL